MIQGKGKGLVGKFPSPSPTHFLTPVIPRYPPPHPNSPSIAVLHGPPGTGKTLTAEGISELLKCPLYMVSAGELGTDSRVLEGELQRILDICHAWGAILLLDEADVFLEKRNMHDIHRNALVSIFLRQLEYFQGILFLTTNRVETFDDAFQSRIHIALRYDPLDLKAKKAIFRMFVEKARSQQQQQQLKKKKNKDGGAVADGSDSNERVTFFTEEDYNTLARHDLNGRQIKNTVIRAQALAVNKGESLSMEHVGQILDVQVNFDRDRKYYPRAIVFTVWIFLTPETCLIRERQIMSRGSRFFHFQPNTDSHSRSERWDGVPGCHEELLLGLLRYVLMDGTHQCTWERVCLLNGLCA